MWLANVPINRIGNDNVPTYSNEPTSCETKSATMFLTTTAFSVSAVKTTATQVYSTSSVVLGCDVQVSLHLQEVELLYFHLLENPSNFALVRNKRNKISQQPFWPYLSAFLKR